MKDKNRETTTVPEYHGESTGTEQPPQQQQGPRGYSEQQIQQQQQQTSCAL